MSSSLLRGRIGFCPSKVMSMAWLPAEDTNSESKGARIEIQPRFGLLKRGYHRNHPTS